MGIAIVEIKNPFGLLNGKLITINDLDEEQRGAKCGCICPNCKAPLVARMGEVYQWHFAHSGTPCENTKLIVNAWYEIVAQIIIEHKCINCPELILEGYSIEPGTVEVEKTEIRKNSNELSTGIIINGDKMAIRLQLPLDYCVDDIRKPIEKLPTLLIDFKNIATLNSCYLMERLCKEESGKQWITQDKDKYSSSKQYDAGLSTSFINNNTFSQGNPFIGRKKDWLDKEKNKDNYIVFDENYTQNKKELFMQHEKRVINQSGMRLIMCDICGKISTEGDFQLYGGLNSLNLGTCRECYPKKIKEEPKKESKEINKQKKMRYSETCPDCGGKLVEREGKYGKFIGCSNYPRCRYSRKH